MPSDGRCSLKEYLEGDDDLQVCIDKGGNDWEASFFEQLDNENEDQEDQNEDDGTETDIEPLFPKVKKQYLR